MVIEHVLPPSVLRMVVFGGQVTVGASSSLTVMVTVQVVVLAGEAPSVAV